MVRNLNESGPIFWSNKKEQNYYTWVKEIAYINKHQLKCSIVRLRRKLEFPMFLQIYDQCTYFKEVYSTRNYT